MNRITTFLVLLSLIIATGCEGTRPLSGREKGVLGGAAIGSGLGAIVGNQSGRAGEGTAIGGAAGALIGGVLGNESDKVSDRRDIQDERLRRQEEEIYRQQRDIDELRRRRGDYPRDSYDRRDPYYGEFNRDRY